jgi:hypothetical protein
VAASYGNQLKFAQWFAYYSGMNGNVILAWCLQEQPPGKPATPGSNNWLNIQYTDQGPNSTYYRIAALDVRAAARESVKWMRANQPSIVAVAHKSARDQAFAIANSGWASSHYGGGDAFYAVVRGVEGHGLIGQVQAGTAPPAPGPLHGVTGSVQAGAGVGYSTSRHDYHEKVKHAGRAAGVHGSALGRINAEHDRMVARIPRF